MEGRSAVSSWRSDRLFFLSAIVTLTLLCAFPVGATPPKIAALIGQIAKQEGLDPNLLTAVVAAESKFKPNSVSNRGAVGLMQLMPGTARLLGVKNPFNPEQNLRGGARYLRQMMELYPDSIATALAAYNAGPGNVRRFGGVPPFPATKRYIKNVLKYYAKKVPGSHHSPKKIYSYSEKREKGGPAAADKYQRIVRLLGNEGTDEAPTLRTPRPTPVPKAVHKKRPRRHVRSVRSVRVTSPKPTHSSRLIPYISTRRAGNRYQAKNVQGTSEEIPIVVLRR